MASLDTDRNKIADALKKYYDLLFPEDTSGEDFEKKAFKKLKEWINKKVELIPHGERKFSLHME